MAVTDDRQMKSIQRVTEFMMTRTLTWFLIAIHLKVANKAKRGDKNADLQPFRSICSCSCI
jgi:hypothetical protein